MTQVNALQAIDSERRFLMPTYARFPVVFEKGERCFLYDSEGRRFLDFVAGIATVGLGHAHPEITEVVSQQAAKLVHTSNLYFTTPQLDLAEEIHSLAGWGRSFFASSGAEAVECAIKLVRKYWQRRDPRRTKLVALENSFHGRTLGALSITGQPSKRTAFEPLVPDVVFVKVDDQSALESSMQGAAALFIEVIQGEGGVRPLPSSFVERIAEVCKESGALLVVDEVQTGLCRTGAWLAFQNEEFAALEPAIFTLGKALGNGFPISACVARDEVAEAFSPGDHATTLGGGPVVSAVGCKVIEIMRREGLASKASKLGERLRTGLLQIPAVENVRGKGLLVGADVEAPAKEVAMSAFEKGLLINAVGEFSIRLCPPLVVGEDEIDEALEVLAESVQEATKRAERGDLG